MIKKVFISSTYRDLKEHRKRIWNVLQAFDIEITGMEEFGARNSTALQTCLEELECCDIYIGVISMCYGSIDIITGKSYTQLEYERAKELGLEILVYLIDEFNGEVKTGNIDYESNKLGLDNFKRILKANHTVDFFINERDLGDKLSKRLQNLIPNDQIELVRPQKLEAKVYRITIENASWLLFIGFLNAQPFELFSAISDEDFGVTLPHSVNSGCLTQRIQDGLLLYDFSFTNTRKYTTTIEGINLYSSTDTYSKDIMTYSKIVSRLLQNRVKKNTLFSIIEEFETTGRRTKEWSKSVIKILETLL